MALSIHRICATTSAEMLERSANAYLVWSRKEAVLIDAGYADSAKDVIGAANRLGVSITGVCLTHYHPDHSLGAPEVARQFSCPIHCHPADRIDLEKLYESMMPMDIPWRPMIRADLIPDSSIHLGDATLRVLHTPGHTHGHIALLHEASGSLFSGDTVIPGGTVWIGPPDGHLQTYLESLDALMAVHCARIYPGHGDVVEEPVLLIQAMKTRRLARERQILDLIRDRSRSVDDLVELLYGDTLSKDLRWVAVKTVAGHIGKLLEEERIERDPQVDPDVPEYRCR
ncbi:MAG: MBL fold metallo-hydrolase [Bacilli bacterium]